MRPARTKSAKKGATGAGNPSRRKKALKTAAPVGVAATASQVGTSAGSTNALAHSAGNPLVHEPANVLTHEAAGMGAGAAGALAALPKPTFSPQLLAGGGVAVAAAAVIAAVTLSGDPEPQPVEPTTTTVAQAAPPVAEPVLFETTAGSGVAGNVLPETAKDVVTISDVDGRSAADGQPVTLASGATVTLQDDGTFDYDPGDSFISLGSGETAEDTISYTVSDGTGWTEIWTATVVVEGENDPPTLEPAAPIDLQVDGANIIELSAADPDSDALSFSLDEAAPAFASLVDAGDGTATLSVTPGGGDAGSYEIQVVVTDDGAPPQTATTTISVTVQPAPAPAPKPERVADQLLARFNFDEQTGDTVGDSEEDAGSSNLVVADPQAVRWEAGHLVVESPTLLRASGSGEINQRVAVSNEVTLEAWITPANGVQAGPARIISLSDGTGSRNATLAQGDPDGVGGDHWTGRIRSTEQSNNGLPALTTGATTVQPGQLTHLALTRSTGGELVLYVNGQPAASGTAGGDLSGWDAGYPLLLGNETTMDRPWLGTYHLVAVYGKALSAGEVKQNFDVGP